MRWRLPARNSLDPFNAKNFILRWFPSLTVQKVKICQWWSMVGFCLVHEVWMECIGPVKPAHMVLSSNKSFLTRFCWKFSSNLTGCAIYCTHGRLCFHYVYNTKLQALPDNSSSSTSSCNLGLLKWGCQPWQICRKPFSESS